MGSSARMESSEGVVSTATNSCAPASLLDGQLLEGLAGASETTMARHERSHSTSGESLYRILHLPKDSTPEAVKASYRKLALRYHPDKNPNDPAAAETFKEINRANAILSDERKKRIYDSYGSAGLHLASMLGEDGENLMASHSNCCVKFLAYFCTIITCCCCCLCCCFCCGKCLPKDDQNDDGNPDDSPMCTDDSNPILAQPYTMSRESSPLNQENEHSYNTDK
ncbi:dnaJ homolog subfamily C member 5-like isoform X2 [Heptranchias perlo]|uniref:dnaJ homolog subfamily C member 5-like isoform X2 n=1 Tax=Heptranchias perlo TaxID=212740 RepID=UPI00355A2DC2